MNISELNWGIELETTLPAGDNTPIGSYHGGTQVPWLPAGWKAERDGSIQTLRPGRKGCEFVSPKLKGAAGLNEALDAADKIAVRGGRVNASCGLHVTIEWNGDAAALARLINLVANHEKGIFATTGTKRRETITYAKPIKSYGNAGEAKRKMDADRYHLLNLTHLARGHNRIEFRAFAGSLNRDKIAGYVMLCLGLVELAISGTRTADWTYAKPEGKKSCWDREGLGQTEVARLFYRLGWTKGWYKKELRDKRFGELRGTDGTAPEWKRVKAKLMEMAAKYDTAA